MAAVGSLGKTIIFRTSDKRILNFNEFKRTVSGRWADHPRVGKKPKKQFLGPGSASVTFTITLNAEFGVKPRKTMRRIEKVILRGTPKKLVIGKKAVGHNKFVITDVSESWERIMDKGEVSMITCDITLEEYL